MKTINQSILILVLAGFVSAQERPKYTPRASGTSTQGIWSIPLKPNTPNPQPPAAPAITHDPADDIWGIPLDPNGKGTPPKGNGTPFVKPPRPTVTIPQRPPSPRPNVYVTPSKKAPKPSSSISRVHPSLMRPSQKGKVTSTRLKFNYVVINVGEDRAYVGSRCIVRRKGQLVGHMSVMFVEGGHAWCLVRQSDMKSLPRTGDQVTVLGTFGNGARRYSSHTP